MLSDIENLDMMLGGNHLEKEGSELNDSIRRPCSPNFEAPEKKRIVTPILGKID